MLSFHTKEAADVPIREEATAIFGDNGLMRFQSTTSGTQGGMTYLVNVAHLTYDGFRTVADSTDFAVERADSSLYGLATRFNVNGQLGLDAAGGRLLITANFMDLEGESPGGLTRDAIYADSSLNARGGGFGNIARNARKDIYQSLLGATWTGPVGNLNAEFVAWGLSRRMNNPIPPRIIDLSRNAYGVRAMVSSDDGSDWGPVTWAAGFDVDLQRDDRAEHTNVGGAQGALTKDQFETVFATGVFLQASTPLGDRVTVAGGLRYDRFDFGVDDRLTTDGDDSGDRVIYSFSPTVGVILQASPELSFFGNFATSLATPTTTELGNNPAGTGGFNPDLDPQTGNTGEIGLRGQARNRFSYEVSGFLSKLNNEIVPFQTDPASRTFYRNSGKSTYQGLEGAVSAVLPQGVFAQLSYTFVDAKFDEFEVDDGMTIEVYDGNFVPGVARHRIEGLVRVIRGPWYGEVRGDHVGKTYTNDANDANTAVKSYTLWDVRTGLSGRRVGNVQLAPFVSLTNVFNSVYSAAVSVNDFTGRYYEPGPRRAFSAGLTATF